MKSAELIARLQANREVFRTLLSGVAPDQVHWKPQADKWSILEVACHLLDEEREDFRVRLNLTLHEPETNWPPIDPIGWVTSRDYAQRELKATLEAFLEEREQSVSWLRGLTSPDWNRAHRHPNFGSMTAGTLLASWAAHDFLHLRQIARLQYEYVAAAAAPHTVRYAGNW